MEQLLELIGLSATEQQVYRALLAQGTASVTALATAARVKRANAYKVLKRLNQLKLVRPDSSKKVLQFTVESPEQLQALVQERQTALNQVDQALDRALPDLLSQYRLTTNKPGVSYFEGKAAFTRILDDSLTATGTIDSILDPEALNAYEQENRAYKAKRFARNIRKRILVADTPDNRARYLERSNQWTIARLIKGFDQSFHTDLQIYNDKVSFLTLKQSSLVGMIIQDPFIVHLHRSVFAQLWAAAEPIGFTPPETA